MDHVEKQIVGVLAWKMVLAQRDIPKILSKRLSLTQKTQLQLTDGEVQLMEAGPSEILIMAMSLTTDGLFHTTHS